MKLLGKIGKVIGPVELLLNEAMLFIEKFEIQSGSLKLLENLLDARKPEVASLRSKT